MEFQCKRPRSIKKLLERNLTKILMSNLFLLHLQSDGCILIVPQLKLNSTTDTKILYNVKSLMCVLHPVALPSLRPCKRAVMFIFLRGGRSPLITECGIDFPAAECVQCCLSSVYCACS